MIGDVHLTGWDAIVGQERAVALLQRSAARPSHAYLLVGPPGSGVEEAARCFAAAVIAPGDPRVFDLVARGLHADVVEIDPAANQIRLEDATQIIAEAHRSPVEGARKAILVFEAERLSLNQPAANKLLKTLEEPPPGVVIVLVTSGADQLLPTIRSRCQRVDFANLGADAIARMLRESGVDDERATLLGGLAGGRLDRARALAGRLGPVRAAFVDAAMGADGTGAHVARAVASVQQAMQVALDDLEASQLAERAELEEALDASPYHERAVRAHIRRLLDRHKRAHRHARTEVLVEGITALETVYRDALAGDAAPRLNTDLPVLDLDARACNRALDACRDARRAIGEFNPNETLLLERLLLHLPACRARTEPAHP